MVNKIFFDLILLLLVIVVARIAISIAQTKKFFQLASQILYKVELVVSKMIPEWKFKGMSI